MLPLLFTDYWYRTSTLCIHTLFTIRFRYRYISERFCFVETKKTYSSTNISSVPECTLQCTHVPVLLTNRPVFFFSHLSVYEPFCQYISGTYDVSQCIRLSLLLLATLTYLRDCLPVCLLFSPSISFPRS